MRETGKDPTKLGILRKIARILKLYLLLSFKMLVYKCNFLLQPLLKINAYFA